jgi:hypothetical protein
MKQIVAGLHGLPGVGKDLLGDYLSLAHGFTKIAFADLLYQQVATAWGVPVGALQDRVWKDRASGMMAFRYCADLDFCEWVDRSFGPSDAERSPREILCRYSDFIKHKTGNPAYYVDHVSSVIAQNADKHFVITDVRYDREAEFIAKLGRSCILEIVKPGPQTRGEHESSKRINDMFINTTIPNWRTKPEFFGLAEWAISENIKDFNDVVNEYRRQIRATRGHSSFRDTSFYRKD